MYRVCVAHEHPWTASLDAHQHVHAPPKSDLHSLNSSSRSLHLFKFSSSGQSFLKSGQAKISKIPCLFQLIWVQLRLIWVCFFECALGHVDQIYLYICIYMLTYVMLIFMCRYNWHCSVIHTYCKCNYRYFLSWASVSALDIKKTSLI